MSPARLFLFDVLHALPVTIAVLSRELGRGRALRAVAALLRRSLGSDPLRAPLGAPIDDADRFTRHQLRPVVHLQDVLESDLGMPREDSLRILAELVGQTGARFIRFAVTLPERERWQRMDTAGREEFGRGILSRFGNADASVAETGERGFGFDVTRCRFVELSARLGRPELAPLFCGADAVYFGRPDSPIHLERRQTLATGGSHCDFRFSWREGSRKTEDRDSSQKSE